MTANIPARTTGRARTARPASRRRRRHIRTKLLSLIAVAGCLALLVVLVTTQALGQLSCSNSPVVINVAVSTDIAPAIQRIAQVFNKEQHKADGRCVQVQVNPETPAIATAQVDGQHPVSAASGQIDAWIPDSSLWVSIAQTFPAGAQTVAATGFSVARSPLMIVMPALAARRLPAFATANWRLLLPRSAGGPLVPPGFKVDLPDPAQSAAGLATVIEVSRQLGPGRPGRISFTRFASTTSVTPYFDDPASLASFASLAAPPLDELPVTVTSEQAVFAFDQANPTQPLAAKYPSGDNSAYGSPELDYPYVLTTFDKVRRDAATVFRQMLAGPYAQGVIRFVGFRSGTGVPDRVPAAYGLDSQLLQPALAAGPTEARVALNAWKRIALGSRDLALIDVSTSMGKPFTPGGASYEKVLSVTASLGLGFFPDSTNMGVWEFANNLTRDQPYKQLVSIGPLSSRYGIVSRRIALLHVNSSLTATGQGSALYGSILAAYQTMTQSYAKQFINALIVLTAGNETAQSDISAQALIKQLRTLYNPTRPVSIIFVIFGDSPNFGILEKIARTTNGQAYEILQPNQVGKVFFAATSRRLCPAKCVKPLSELAAWPAVRPSPRRGAGALARSTSAPPGPPVRSPPPPSCSARTWHGCPRAPRRA